MVPPVLSVPGVGKIKILDPASSAGYQGRKLIFRKDILESAIRSTVSVANGYPSVLSPLGMFDINEL